MGVMFLPPEGGIGHQLASKIDLCVKPLFDSTQNLYHLLLRQLVRQADIYHLILRLPADRLRRAGDTTSPITNVVKINWYGLNSASIKLFVDAIEACRAELATSREETEACRAALAARREETEAYRADLEASQCEAETLEQQLRQSRSEARSLAEHVGERECDVRTLAEQLDASRGEAERL